MAKEEHKPVFGSTKPETLDVQRNPSVNEISHEDKETHQDVDPVGTLATSSSSLKFAHIKSPLMMGLPDELLILIIHFLFLDIFWNSVNHSCLRYAHTYTLRPDLACVYCPLIKWFKYTLPYISKRFHDLMAPSLLPFLAIGEKQTEVQKPITSLTSDASAVLLPHIRHLSIKYRMLDSSCYAGQDIGKIAHTFLILLASAPSLETLQIDDLLITLSDDSMCLHAQFRNYGKALPWQFDPTCSHLLQVLPETSETALLPRFQDLIQHVGVGFPRLRRVLLMDGNSGISADDYANLFLVPRDTCNLPRDQTIAPMVCRSDTATCGLLTTACPSLESLTLLLWYPRTFIDADLMTAMCHLKQHHPNLKELKLISRRLRCQVLEAHKVQQWFNSTVIPILCSIPEQLLRGDCVVTIYILTAYHTSLTLDDVIKRYTPTLRQKRGFLRLQVLEVSDFRPNLVYHALGLRFRRDCLVDTSLKREHAESAATQQAEWVKPLTVEDFFERKISYGYM